MQEISTSLSSASPDGVVALDSDVEIEGDGERDVCQLVDPCKANVAAGRMSVAAPLARLLWALPLASRRWSGGRPGSGACASYPSVSMPTRCVEGRMDILMYNAECAMPTPDDAETGPHAVPPPTRGGGEGRPVWGGAE